MFFSPPPAYVHNRGVGTAVWYLYSRRTRVLSARGMLFFCPRTVEPLGWCWYSMGMVWYVVRYGVAWCVG